MGTIKGVKGAWKVNFFIFLLTGSQSVLLPWTPIILKSAGIEAAGTGLAVGLSIIFSSFGIGIALAILRRTYSGAVRRIILLVLLLTSTIFYLTSVFLIPIQNTDKSCYNYKPLINIPADSSVGGSVLSNVTVSSISDDHANGQTTVPLGVAALSNVTVSSISDDNANDHTTVHLGGSVLSNVTVSSISDDHANDHTTVPPTSVTTSQIYIKLYTYPSTASEKQPTPYLSNNESTNKSKENEDLNKKSTSPLVVTQAPLILNSTASVTNVSTKKIGTITEVAKPSSPKPNEINNTSESMIVKTTKKSTIHVTTLPNKDTTNDETDHGSKNKTDNKHKKHKPSGRNVNFIRNSTEADIHTVKAEESIVTQSIDESLDNSNVDDSIDDYEINNYDQNYYQNYNLQGDSRLNSYYQPPNNLPEINSFDTHMQKPALYNSYGEINEPISTHNRKGNKRPLLAGSDFINNYQSNQNPYPWALNSRKSLSSFQEDTSKNNKGHVDNSYYNQRQSSQKHSISKVPPLKQYIQDHKIDQNYFHPHQNKKYLHNVHNRQRRSPAIRKDFTFNTSDTLIDSIITKKDGLQIDISGETVKTVASAGIATLLIIGGILGSGVEAAVAQLWHCYAHGYDEGGVSHDILERTITHTFHLSVYPQHRRWSTVTAGCWAVLGGMMSAIGCSLGSTSGLWTGQAALHLAMALLSLFALLIIPVPYGTVDPPKTRRPLSLYLDDEVLREGLRRLAFHGWVLLSGAVSAISITFGLWLIQETASSKGLGIASQACAIFLSLASEGMTLHCGHWIVSRGGVLGTMFASGVALSIHCGVLWATSEVWLMAVVHVTAGMAHGCLWLAVKHNALLLATINDQEREAWVSWCSWRSGMGIGAMLWGSWVSGLSGAMKPLFAAAGAVAMLQAIAVSISWILGRKQIRSRRRIYHTLDLDMEDEDAEEEDDDEEDDWLVKRAKKEGITL